MSKYKNNGRRYSTGSKEYVKWIEEPADYRPSTSLSRICPRWKIAVEGAEIPIGYELLHYRLQLRLSNLNLQDKSLLLSNYREIPFIEYVILTLE